MNESLAPFQQSERVSHSSSSEDLFIDIFQEALGFERAQLLIPQYPAQDIYGKGRYIDFALFSSFAKYAFEIDGEAWHLPGSQFVSADEFRDSLLRQNSLMYQGWRVYRWTDAQLAAERDRILEQLRLFLEREVTEGALDGFLPLQQGQAFSLHEHQSDALHQLHELRSAGNTIALLTHATGTGKTHTALSDARKLGLRTLYLAHRADLLKQTQTRFQELWPEAACTIFQKSKEKPATQVVLSTIQSLADSCTRFDPQEFGYIIVDEAHHAAADSYRKVIRHFKPRFILGLTATPERYDGRSLLEVFQTTAHRLELEEAVSRGLLVPIRCVRVKTNVDLTAIRFNGVDYRSTDLGQSLFLPSRDALIAETYQTHTLGKHAVCFCVNVEHAERMTLEFERKGIKAAHVSGRMNQSQRLDILESYRTGKVQVLCACDILTEGWDSPETEVLLMARPTLSKVVYVQQLGRGTRTAPGKKHLLVFDFIDNTTRYAQALSAHRLFRKELYYPGGLVAAPPQMITDERQNLGLGKKPLAELALHVWVEKYEPVDIFRWQEEVRDMFQTSQLEAELGVGENTVRRWIETGKIIPDHSIELGTRPYHYFHKNRVDEIRKEFGLPRLTGETVKARFFEFVRAMDMRTSYKPVLLLGLLNLADSAGRVKTGELVVFFRNYYRQRLESGLLVEAPTSRLNRVTEMSDSEIETVMLAMPFEKFERRKFVRRLKDVTVLKIWEPLWNALTESDKADLKRLAHTALDSYYGRFK
ncbi:MAG: DEAD/DEAH box helicase family protein [Blastocatellia bacterium]|nr:DEAD/DEAH box helicase family protein [Blastocatellia bacterium]